MDVVALGELLIDFTCTGTDADGYPVMTAHPGGAPANFLAALSRFGAETALLGKVGTDAFGHLLVSTLEKAGVETSGIVLDDRVFTTLAFVTLDKNGEREFSFARKPGADTCLSFEELQLSLIEKTKFFHFGTLSMTDEPARSATCRAVEYARKCAKRITFDPNLRRPLWKDLEEARRQMLWGIAQADIVKISDEEAEFLWGLSPAEAAVHILAEYNVCLVFVTCGAEGCYFGNPKAVGHLPALGDIPIVDTTGAGDIFAGSAVWKLLQLGKAPEELEEQQLREIVRFASTAAGLSTTKAGGISSVPDYEQVMKHLMQ